MGRGSSKAGASWRGQLRAAAKQGKMPKYIMGDTAQQVSVFKEIDKIYDMPSHEGARINDQGDRVIVTWKGRVTGMGYPSKEKATESEKRGVLKMLLYNMK